MSAVYYRNGVLSIPDSEAKKEWDRANTQRVIMKLNKNTDSDIISRLEEVPNKQGYIKTLIRQDLAGKNK